MRVATGEEKFGGSKESAKNRNSSNDSEHWLIPGIRWGVGGSSRVHFTATSCTSSWLLKCRQVRDLSSEISFAFTYNLYVSCSGNISYPKFDLESGIFRVLNFTYIHFSYEVRGLCYSLCIILVVSHIFFIVTKRVFFNLT